MADYQLSSPYSGRNYEVTMDGDPSDDDFEYVVNYLDQQAAQAETEKPFLNLGDAVSGIGDALGGLRKTLPAAYYRLTEGFERPDKYSAGASAAFDAEAEYAQAMQDESTARLLKGEASSTGDTFRSVGPSLGFSAASMAAAIPAGAVGAKVGAAGGGAVGGGIGAAFAGVGAVPGAAAGATIGGVVGGAGASMTAAGTAAYRMAGAQFLDDAFKTWLANNPQADEASREEAYQELLPLAKDAALWEAGPEAIGTVVGLGAGKVVLGLGKQTLTKLATGALGKAGIKAGALAGGVGTELLTETATQIGQGEVQAKADAFAAGQDMSTAKSPYDVPGGTLQAFKDVAPQTLALSGLMLGAGGAVKAASFIRPKAEPVAAAMRDGAEVAAEFRQRAVLRPEAPITGMEEHVSDLTAEDVADIEEANRYANPQDPSLSPETIPGNLGEDVTQPTRFTDAEAADRVRRIEASLHSRGELPTGQKLLPATTGELDQLGKGSSAAFAQAFAGLFRRRVVVLKGLGADQFGGVTNDQIKDTVFINASSPRAIHSLVGHEMVHHLEVAHPDLFQRLDDVLQPDVQSMDQARKTYAGYAGKGDLNVRREIYADLMGESMSDPTFWGRLGQHEPGLFMPLARSVWRWFQDVVTALKRQGWEASQHFRDVQRAQAALAEAMAEFARRENGLTPQEAQRVVNGLLSGDNFFEGLKAPEIMGPNEVKETQSRFARPEQKERLYPTRQDVTVRSQAEAWLDGRTLAAAVDALASSELPDGIPSEDVRQQAIGQALMRATAAMQRGDEFARTQARVLANKAARLYQDAGRESARSLRQRAVMNAELVPIAPVLAAESLLIDRADSVMDKRFEGGAKGGAAKVDAAAKKSGKAGGEELAKKLERRINGRKREEADEEAVKQRAENRASQLIYSVEERLRQGSKDLKKNGSGADTINRAFRDQVTDPLPWESFAARLAKLNVGEEVAGRMFQTAQREAQDQAAMVIYRAEKARLERAERTASQLIYRTEERLRQGSKDLDRTPGGDSINQAFRDQIVSPLEAAAFRARLQALAVPDWLSDRLFNTAKREAADRAAMRQFEADQAAREMAKDESSLARMLNELRKKMFPGMNWQAIFEELPSQQRERQREIYTRLRKDERLRNLSSAEVVGLTNELDKAWQRERRKVFLRELEKAGALGEKDATDRQKSQKAAPKLLRAINLGLMNSETFREAVAQEYNLKMISGADAAKLRTLAEEAYALPEGLMQNRKLAELLSSLQKTTGGSLAELLNSYWVAAVLSGSRTMFDTFASVTNGLGTQAIQTAMLAIYQKNPRAAFQAMQQWFWGIRQAFPEAMNILVRGDYSYQKRFNADLNKALEGESTFRPVPLGEALWKDGNWFEKWGMAPVMMWTGRLMAAADHINNTATTAGAMAVARALHPEIYDGKAGFTAEEKAAAMAQAKREMLGGEDRVPATRQEGIDLQARQREILAGSLRPEERKEASFIGDQAAYQNDPTGLFGGIYEGVNMGLGHMERLLAAHADGYANTHARALLLFLSGAMRSAMGVKFIRFGANFANDTVSYIPGTMLIHRELLGHGATASQKQLFLGKNIFGLMLGLSLAAMFLGKDDEEEGWHSEGGWLDLSPDEVKQRMAAGIPRHCFWRRKNGKIEALSYKQWPTAGLVAAVAHMQDRQRFAPEKWESAGMTGHLLAAASVGMLQVKEAAAMRGLAELMGGNKFGPNPEEDLVERLAKVPANFAGGFIPTLVKDFDLLADPQRYKPEGIFEDFIRNVPVVRRNLAGGRPELNILGVPILQDRKPWSRTYTQGEHGVAHVILSKLMARGVQLPVPSTNKRVFVNNAWTTIDALGGEAEWKYQKYVGEGYAAFLTDQRELLMKLQGDPLKRFISNSADRIKSMAAMRVADQSK